MASVDESSKRAALMRARDRLEAALQSDEGWQALKRSEAHEGLGGHVARLEVRMLSNPLYRAWKNVTDAIEALPPANRSNEAAGAGGAPGESAHAPAMTAAEPPVAPSPPAPEEAAAVSAAAGEEAAVSFVARTPRTSEASLEGRPATPHPAADAVICVTKDEAEVAVRSLDDERHAAAVERLVRALHGETNAS